MKPYKPETDKRSRLIGQTHLFAGGSVRLPRRATAPCGATAGRPLACGQPFPARFRAQSRVLLVQAPGPVLCLSSALRLRGTATPIAERAKSTARSANHRM
jgi:hypothetical protein